MKRALLVFVLILVGTLSVSAQDTANGRVLAITAVPPLEPLPTDEDFIAALQLADEFGTTGDVLTWKWSELEPSPGEYALNMPLMSFAFLGHSYDHTLYFGIQVLNTTTRETPADLIDVPFDDPRMLERFKALIDALKPLTNDHLKYVSIGNEVDVYLANHPDEWATYKTFYDAAADYVRAVMPGVQVGVTATYGGALLYEAELADLNETSDIYILTYYPLTDGFIVQPPDSPLTDFPRMIELAGERPLILQEVGYPAAETLGSSAEAQAEFVRNVYAAWDAAGGRIPFLSFFLMGDLNDELCTSLTEYYGLPDNNHFYDYLCTLGFRTVDGTPRAAWDAFLEGAAALTTAP